MTVSDPSPSFVADNGKPFVGRGGTIGIGIFMALSGAAAGVNILLASTHLNLLKKNSDNYGISYSQLTAAMVVGAGLFSVFFLGLRMLARAVERSLPPEAVQTFQKRQWMAYLPAGLTFLGVYGYHVPLALLAAGVLLAGFAVLFSSLPRGSRGDLFSSQGWLAFLFLISGMAALIYQIVWQRKLFSIYGVNIESITIVVSLFMFGLGVGSFFGGYISRHFPGRAPELFLVCEVGIGLFGLISLPLISAVGAATLSLPLTSMSLVIFALLAVPTFLMGATLPILVSHLYRYFRNVGQSVGLLYCINTFGSALACFLTVDLLFIITGLQGAVIVAALCNLVVGVLVWDYARRLSRDRANSMLAADPSPEESSGPVDEADRTGVTPPLSSPQLAPSSHLLVLLFAAGIGYISLSQEILWMRIISYMTGGEPVVFGRVLGCFLIGVALGALFGKWLCQKYPTASLHGVVAVLLLTSGLCYYGSIHVTSWIADDKPIEALALIHAMVVLISLLMGGIFPILCHQASTAGQHVGLTVSRVYVANIIGSTLGPLVTGFVLMDHFATTQIILGLSLATLVLAVVAWVFSAGQVRWLGVGLAGGCAVGLALLDRQVSPGLFLRLHQDGKVKSFSHVIERRSGVITVKPETRGGGAVYGGGCYDGRFNIDPVLNINWIDRCYWFLALHDNPKTVLVVGLSTGSWARVGADYDPVKRLTIVEINPGYLDLLPLHEDHASLLHDPRVTIHIDDGRRWLARNEQQFDMIVQNYTFHWRSESTHLLSREYFQLCKDHLNPNGKLFLNTTDSDDVCRTVAEVFRHVVKYRNCIAASDSPFTLTDEQMRQNLLQFVHEGEVVFEKEGSTASREKMVSSPRTDLAPALRDRDDLYVITDDNMACEFKRYHWLVDRPRWNELRYRLP